MSNNELTGNSSYIHERVFHIPTESKIIHGLGEAALPKTGLIDTGQIPGVVSQPVVMPGDVFATGAQHQPVDLGTIDQFPGNPERAINHHANIAKTDREFTAMTGIAIRRDYDEKE